METDAGIQIVHTCGDILQYAIGGDATVCTTSTTLTTTQATACNLFESYCNGCVTNTWTCSTSSQCVYTGPCNTTATYYDVYGYCPPLSRTGRALGLKCSGPDGGTAGTCTSTAGCTVNTDCLGQVADNGATCNGADCVCFQNACYFQCANDLDCPGGYACDSTSKVCKASGCTSDTACKTQLGNVKAVCNTMTGACALPCATDHDCSPSSGAVKALGSFTNSVCGTDGFCASVINACSTNADCITTSESQVNTFCVPVAPQAAYRSAITN